MGTSNRVWFTKLWVREKNFCQIEDREGKRRVLVRRLIGRAFRQQRVKTPNLTTEAVAYELDLDPAFYRQIEQGKWELSDRLLRAISSELGMPFSEVSSYVEALRDCSLEELKRDAYQRGF